MGKLFENNGCNRFKNFLSYLERSLIQIARLDASLYEDKTSIPNLTK